MHLRRALAAALAATALATGTASAAEPLPDGIVELVPNLAGKPSKLTVDVDPRKLQSGPAPEELPRSLSAFFQRGFRFDARAVKGRCSSRRAEEGTCPRSSRIGTGSAQGTATSTFTGTTRFTASIGLFLARPRTAGDLGDVIIEVNEPQSGLRGSARGRFIPLASGPFAGELRVDLSNTAQAPPGFTVEVERVQLRAGARRVIRVRRRVGGRMVTRKRRYRLITNPRTCRGEWLIRLRALYADRTVERDATPGCRGGG